MIKQNETTDTKYAEVARGKIYQHLQKKKLNINLRSSVALNSKTVNEMNK